MWLLQNNPGLTSLQAYDQARREFYEIRLQQDVERRVAKEEALATGAYFGKSALQVGMELEDRAFERWKEWAQKEALLAEQKRAASDTGSTVDELPIPSTDDPELDAGLDDIGSSISAQEQDPLGGPIARP